MRGAISADDSPLLPGIKSEPVTNDIDVPPAGRRHTIATYEQAIKPFKAYCKDRKVQWLPARPIIVEDYLAACFAQGLSYATLRVYKAAISYFHRRERKGDPTRDEFVKKRWVALVSAYEREEARQYGLLAPAVEKIIAAITRELVDDELEPYRRLIAVRDRALILTMYEAALSTYELSSLEWERVVEDADGYRLFVFSASDAGKPRPAFMRRGPARRDAVGAIEAHRAQSGARHATSFVFRGIDRWSTIGDMPLGKDSVNDIINERCRAVEIDPKIFSPKSLRIGRAMQAALDGEDTEAALERLGLHAESKTRIGDVLAPAIEARLRGTRGVETLEAGSPGEYARLIGRHQSRSTRSV